MRPSTTLCRTGIIDTPSLWHEDKPGLVVVRWRPGPPQTPALGDHTRPRPARSIMSGRKIDLSETQDEEASGTCLCEHVHTEFLEAWIGLIDSAHCEGAQLQSNGIIWSSCGSEPNANAASSIREFDRDHEGILEPRLSPP